MVKNEYELTRTNSICPSPHELLLDYVEKNEEDKIRNLIEDNPELLSHIYDYPYYKPILHICCSHFKETVQPRVVEELINLGADVSFSQELDDYKEALHFAAESTRPVILETIVKHIKRQPKGNISAVDKNGNTALHALIKNGETDSSNFLVCAKILIENGIDINKADCKNQTVVLLAAKKGYNDIINLLLKQPNIDIDSHKLRGKTAREWIGTVTIPEEIGRNNNCEPNEILFSYLKQNKQTDFINFSGDIANVVNKDDGSNTLLQLACMNGQTEAVRYLLSNGADPNITTSKNRKSPIEVAAESGYHEIFKELLENQKTLIPQNTVCTLLKYINHEKMGATDYEKCYDLLRENRRNINLNEGDSSKNTPLHYAIAYASKEKVLELLDSGASLAAKNDFGILPVQDISPDLLEQHLDNCLKLNNEKDDIRENCIVTVNYRTLVPPQKEDKEKLNYDAESNPLHEVQELMAETEVVCYMSKSKELKHLLKHPVISSFLFMKWHRMRWFFYTNLAFYITFALSLILYVLVYYSQPGDGKDVQHTVFSTFLTFILSLSFVILIFREIFQLLVSPNTYILSFENWIEICLIAVTFYILVSASNNENTRKQLSAFAVLLTTFEFVLLVGQHPNICTNVVMLRTVSYNFFKFLLWFSILILAFAFSFYVLFNNNNNSEVSSSNNRTEAAEQDFFSDPGLSIIKTIVMLTGEFDAGSMNFQTFPLTSRLIFLMFVFMIAIILFNLLNGLAVSDTQLIQSDAELVSLIARADHIRYIENMILGNLFPNSVVKIARNVCCCVPSQTNFNITVPKILSQRICLFPYYLPNYRLQFYPMKMGEIIFQHDTSDGSSCLHCSKMYLDSKTVRHTLCKLQERKTEKVGYLESVILNLQKSVDELIREQKDILAKVQTLTK